jgi:hypothetical protein
LISWLAISPLGFGYRRPNLNEVRADRLFAVNQRAGDHHLLQRIRRIGSYRPGRGVIFALATLAKAPSLRAAPKLEASISLKPDPPSLGPL